MKPFELLEPRSLDEAVALLQPADTSVRVASGCTALMLMMKAGILSPARLVSLRRIEPRHAQIEMARDEVTVGATCTLATIEHSEIMERALPVLTRTLRTTANVRVRNAAMLGGCLAHADPHMDLPPVLCALGATATITSKGAQRELDVEALITGYYETALQPGELITQVRIPTRLARRCVYRKITARSAGDWPTLGVAVALDIVDRTVREASIVASAAFDRPTRLTSAQAALRGASINARSLEQASEAAAADAEPIADAHGSAAYKRELLRVHVRRALESACAMDA